MECRKIQEMLAAYLDGVASPEEERLIKGHISSCHECSSALEDLKRAGELIKGLPEIEPPPWFRQRVMARIKAEEEAKKSLFRKLFYPLHIKVPIEGLATAVVAAAAFLILRAVGPETKTSQVPSTPQVAAEGRVSKGVPQAPTHRPSHGKRIRAEAGPASAEQEPRTKGSPFASGGEGGRTEGVQDEASEAKEATPSSQLPAGPAAVTMQKDEMAVGTGIRRDVRQKALSAPVRGLSLAEKKRESIGITVHAGDVAKALQEIENLFAQLGASRIRRQSAEGGEVIIAELEAARLKVLFEQLKSIGRVDEKDTVPDVEPGLAGVRIKIISQ